MNSDGFVIITKAYVLIFGKKSVIITPLVLSEKINV